MTLISKVKTLIEYAKCGMAICKLYHGEKAELYLPTSIAYFDRTSFNFKNNTTAIYGKTKHFGGTRMLVYDNTLEIVDLPECITVHNSNILEYASALRICKLPKVRQITAGVWYSCSSLEYVELGALTLISNQALSGCSSLHTFICGEGTACNLFLYHSENLTQECLHNIIDNVADLNGVSSYKLHIGSVNLAKISPEYLQKLVNKNWTYA